MLIHEARAVPVLAGCFSSSHPLISQGTYKYQSSGHCNGICTDKNQAVLGLSTGDECWCGNELPALESEVPGSNCNTTCQGYSQEECGGGSEYLTVWLTGLTSNVHNYDGAGSGSTSSSTSSTSTQSSQGTSTPSATTSPANAQAQASKDSSSSNSDQRLGIILGAVLGAVALTIMIFLFWLLRRRRRRTGSYFRAQTPGSTSDEPFRLNGRAASTRSATTVASKASSRWEKETLQRPTHAASEPARPPMAMLSGPSAPERPPPSYKVVNEAPPPTRPVGRDMAFRSQESLPPSLLIGSPPPNDIQRTYINYQQNPFSGDEEAEATEAVSPILPSFNADRQPKSMVHYPSMSEVSDFDFSGRDRVRSYDGGARGWHPAYERREGRHELP